MEESLRTALLELHETQREFQREQRERDDRVAKGIADLTTEMRVSHASIEQRLLSVQQEQHDSMQRHLRVAATVHVLEGAEARREERWRLAKWTGKAIGALIVACGGLLGIGTALGWVK